MSLTYSCKIKRNTTMSRHLILVAYLLSCGSAIIGSLNRENNYLALASPSSASSSSSSSGRAINQQQPEELVDQLSDVSQNDNNNNNNNINNDQSIFEQQQNLYRTNNNNEQQQAPLYSYLRGSPASSASFIPPFTSTYIMTPSQGTNGNNNNNLYLPIQHSFLSHSSRLGQFGGGGGGQLDPFDFDSINWNAANLMREGRAYKPKIMSTARGFGKRSFGTNGGLSSLFDGKLRHVTYADLMASANPTNNYASNNNLSGHGIRWVYFYESFLCSTIFPTHWNLCCYQRGWAKVISIQWLSLTDWVIHSVCRWQYFDISHNIVEVMMIAISDRIKD